MTASPITKAPETPLDEARAWLPLRAVHVEGSDGFHRLYTASGGFIASCVNGREAIAFAELCNAYPALQSSYDSLARELEQLKEEIPLLDAVLTQARVVLLSSIQSDGQPSQSSLAKLSDLCRAHYDRRTQRIAAALKPSNEVGT